MKNFVLNKRQIVTGMDMGMMRMDMSFDTKGAE